MFSNRKRQAEEDILKGARELDPDDDSSEAQQIRETAEDIQDHHDSQRWNTKGSN
jgi:hypothetical protein